MSDKKLRPCPFCGSEEVNATTAPEPDEHGLYYWVCPDCICCGPTCDTPDGASKAWGLNTLTE